MITDTDEDIPEHMATIADVLQTTGMNAVDARRAAMIITKEHSKHKTFVELYGRGSLVTTAHDRKELGVRGLRALDLRTCRPDGQYWDFNRRNDRRWARQLLREQNPDWIIGSPPCNAFCAFNRGLNFSRMPRDAVDARIAEGKRHLMFAAELYRYKFAEILMLVLRWCCAMATWFRYTSPQRRMPLTPPANQAQGQELFIAATL